jgi:hypothetical protein
VYCCVVETSKKKKTDNTFEFKHTVIILE